MIALLGLLCPSAHAATSTKQNNSTVLNLASSWDTLPGAADIGQWTSAVTSANSPALGADLSLLGLKVVNPGGLVTLASGNTLTLGAAGFDLSSATQNLTLNAGLTLQGQQSWKVAASRTLDVAGTFSRSGATVDFTNFNATATLGTLANDSSGILGSWATTGAATSLNYVKSTAGAVSAFTAQTAATAADLSNVTNPATHYSFAAAATQIGPITANTLRFTGSASTLANGGFSTTLNGLMNAGTGTLTSSGSGDLIIGTNRELVILANGSSTIIGSRIVNSTAGASSVTYSGGGNLTLSAVNTYSGGTTVNSGSLLLTSQNGLGTGPVTLAAGITFQQDQFEGNSSAGALPNAFILSGIGNVTMNLPFGGGKDVWLNQNVSGTGGFTVQGGGRKLTLTANNSFSGGVRLTNDGNTLQISHLNALGTGTFRTESSINNSVLIPLTDLVTGSGVSNAIDIASGAYLNINTSGDGGTRSLLLSGPITNPVGTGNLNKFGSGTLTLSGANTYSGNTKIAGGTLALSTAGSLGGGALDISTGASIALNFTGTRHITALTFNGGAAQAAGTYGAAGSGATNTSTSFSGTGTLTVGGTAFAVSTTTLALTSGSTPAAVGASLTFTATVSGGAPSGGVTFYDGVTPIGTQALSGSTASFTTTSLALGTHSITARYAGNTSNDPSGSAVFSVQVANPTDILNFTFPGLQAATITGTNITVTVPFSTNISALAPTYTLSSGGTCVPASGSTQNFTNPQSYIVSAAGFPDKTYNVIVTKAAALTLKDITSFVFPGLPATTIGANTVSVTVPFGTNVTNLSPTFTVSSLATGSPATGTSRNFSTGQIYTITAEDSTTKTYTVTVNVAAASAANNILSCDFGALGPATITGTNIILTVPPNQSVTSLAPTFSISPLATINPVSGSTQNFTSPVSYTVTAQNGSTQVYSVAVQSYESWTNSASFFILTTPEGANISSGTAETNFPLLLRLNSSNFTFSQAQSDGRDIRFTTLSGTPLAYQIEQWDNTAGTAAVWIKIPSISPNARQEIKMYWGKNGVSTESSGLNVFNSANGYVSVMHLNETVADSVGTLNPTNIGTSVANSLIGKGRTFVAGNGVNCGDNLTSLPSGNTAHSTQAWYRSDTSGFDIFDWAREDSGKKVQIRLVSPPRIVIDGNFAGVVSNTILSTSQWHHVVNTYTPGNPGVSRIYIDGLLDATNSATVSITPPSIMRLGGWYNNYGFVGEMDEARLSKVTRSANWIKMEYENQRAQQTLVGNLVQAGTTFSVTPSSATLLENTSTTLTALAGGAQKVSWIEKRNGVDTVLANDQFTLPVAAGRVTGTQSYIIQFKAIYASSVQTVDVPITITEDLPDPEFTLTGPATWDGRQTITVTPNLSNLAALQAKNVANLTYTWTVGGVAAAKTITPGTPSVPGVLVLTRSQGSGPMTVTLVLNNGGTSVTATKTITVTEPATDAWVQRTPGADEIPEAGQFYARDDSGKGKIFYNGTQSGTPDSVFLKVYTTDTGSDVIFSTQRQNLVSGKYTFTAPIDAGRVTYKVTYGTTSGGTDTVLNTVTNLVCGDAYIFEGQSNALATDSLPADATNNDWVRTYGNDGGAWGNAVRNGSQWTVGYFAFDLAVSLSATYDIPICIMNGAIGGTRIDQHQANPVDHTQAGSRYAIYANLLNRINGGKLTHGIRGVFWHQGESNSGSDAPTGDFDYKSYQQYFVDMSAAWKQDYPNIGRYIVFQVMPKPCALGPKGDQLREVQRTLPSLFSKMDILTTLKVPGYIGCHFTAEGYQNVADRTLPLAKQRFYGFVPPASVTAPVLQRAYFTSSARTSIGLVFDQPMSWSSFSTSNYFLDKVGGKVISGSDSGNVITLQLSSAASATAKLDYLEDDYWNFNELSSSLIHGANGIPALTFADVAIAPPTPTSLVATAGNGQVALTWTASAGASGYNVQRSLTSGGPYAVIGTAAGTSFTDTSVMNGTVYYYVVSATTTAESPVSNQVSASPVAPVSAFVSWASDPTNGLTAGVNDSPLDDPDHDGIVNLLEFTLGGQPVGSATAILPKFTAVAGAWAFEYERSDLSLAPATIQVVEYGSNLTGWTQVPIPTTSSGSVTITPGSPSDHVKVLVPAVGSHVFARLKVSQP
jgi:autotransporter-associated beta strand protein